jgi:hypothetical protein
MLSRDVHQTRPRHLHHSPFYLRRLEMSLSYEITCLCGANTQTVNIIDGSQDKTPLTICHCDACRFSSGQLCTSYHPIVEATVTDKLRVYRSDNDTISRYFCRVCGCHIFQKIHAQAGQTEVARWEVATGTLKGPAESTGHRLAEHAVHAHVADTGDGGAAVWLQKFNGEAIKHDSVREEPSARSVAPLQQGDSSDDRLPASCACGAVRYFVTRPNKASYEPHSPYSDLIYVFATTAADIVSNPRDDKWWIRGDGRKYMAGTCACRSCRLFSGFEIQNWAFIPRKNIFIHPRDAAAEPQLLDFSSIPSGILQSYSSSPGVTREFCGTCGATVFWHCDFRPDLVDVSVGLLRAQEGARAESWLEWWTDRVSFDEETETGRHGPAAATARELINSLAQGLKAWKQEK